MVVRALANKRVHWQQLHGQGGTAPHPQPSTEAGGNGSGKAATKAAGVK